MIPTLAGRLDGLGKSSGFGSGHGFGFPLLSIWSYFRIRIEFVLIIMALKQIELDSSGKHRIWIEFVLDSIGRDTLFPRRSCRACPGGRAAVHLPPAAFSYTLAA